MNLAAASADLHSRSTSHEWHSRCAKERSAGLLCDENALAEHATSYRSAGENWELRADLNSEYRDKRKDAIKRVIANMTVGKDVSGLFPDVLKNMQTEDLEQKKLVYLYLMNYAKTQPELVILAVNTFVKVRLWSSWHWGLLLILDNIL